MAGPKLIKGLQATYEPAMYPGENTSGLKPYGKNVLVRVDECAKMSAGAVMYTDDFRDQMTSASTSGSVYYVAPEAFRLFEDGTPWQGEAPKVGDRICFEKYAGQLQKGVDDHTYRIMDYRAIACGVDMEYVDSIGMTVDPKARKAS